MNVNTFMQQAGPRHAVRSGWMTAPSLKCYISLIQVQRKGVHIFIFQFSLQLNKQTISNLLVVSSFHLLHSLCSILLLWFSSYFFKRKATKPPNLQADVGGEAGRGGVLFTAFTGLKSLCSKSQGIKAFSSCLKNI